MGKYLYWNILFLLVSVHIHITRSIIKRVAQKSVGKTIPENRSAERTNAETTIETSEAETTRERPTAQQPIRKRRTVISYRGRRKKYPFMTSSRMPYDQTNAKTTVEEIMVEEDTTVEDELTVDEERTVEEETTEVKTALEEETTVEEETSFEEGTTEVEITRKSTTAHKPTRKGRRFISYRASITKYPFIASLQTSYGHFCSATIINNNWFLTINDCVQNTPFYTIVACLGSVSIEKKHENCHQIMDIEFDGKGFLALMKTKDKIVFTPAIQPAVLLTREQLFTKLSGL